MDVSMTVETRQWKLLIILIHLELYNQPLRDAGQETDAHEFITYFENYTHKDKLKDDMLFLQIVNLKHLFDNSRNYCFLKLVQIARLFKARGSGASAPFDLPSGRHWFWHDW